MAIDICNFVEYEGKKYSKAVFRDKVLKGEIVLNKINNRITNNDRIIFAHPGIGKTYLKENGKDIISLDDDYKEEHGIAKILRSQRNESKEAEEEYKKYLTEWWAKAKADAKLKNKQLFVSNLPILEMFPNDFDKIISMSKELFLNRSKQRNDYIEGETEKWKDDLDNVIATNDISKLLFTDKYLSDLLTNDLNQNVDRINPPSAFHFAPTSGQASNINSKPKTFEGVVGKIAADKKRIKLKDDIITEGPLKGQRMHTWVDTVTGIPFKMSITESIHGKLAKKNEEQQNMEGLSLAQHGTDAHKFQEDFAEQFLNEDGSFNDKPIVNNTIRPAYKKTTQYLCDFLKECKELDPNARVFTEAVIGKADYSVAGAIDIIVVFSDLSYRKLDWKFIKKLGYNGVDAKRREEFEKQANLQAKILADEYGLVDRRMDYMVPLRVHGTFSKTETNPDGSPKFIVSAVDATPYDISKLNKDSRSLEPVIIYYAKSDKDQLMSIYSKLHDASKLIMEMVEKGTPQEKREALDRYNALIKVANDLVFRQDIMSLTQEINAEVALMEHYLKEDKLEQLTRHINLLNAYKESAMLSKKREEILNAHIDLEKNPEKKKILEARKTAYEAAMGSAESLINKINEASKNFRIQKANELGLGNAAISEPEVGFGTTHMLRTSMIQMKTLQMVRMYMNQGAVNWTVRTTQLSKKFIDAVERVTKELKGNNIELFKKHLLQRNSQGNFRIIPAFKASQTDESENFWVQKKKASDKRDLEWFKANTIFNKERYDKDLEAFIKDWDNSVMLGRRTKEQRNKAVADFKSTYNVGVNFTNEDAIAQESNNNFGNIYLIGNEKWYSDEFKYIRSVPALLNLYDTMIEFNGYLVDAGIIEESHKYSFFPSVENSLADAWMQGDKEVDVIKRFFNSISVDTGMSEAGVKVDPTTKEEWKSIRVAHVNPISDASKQNADIGRVYTIMAEQLAKAEVLQQFEPIFEKLLIAEAQQQVKQTNAFGNPTGKDVANVKNVELAKVLTEYMLYGAKQSNLGVSNTFLRKTLDLMGLHDRSISWQKVFEGFIMWNSLVRIGFSPSTIVANVVGGMGMLSFLAKQAVIFDTEQFVKAEYFVMSNNKKVKAAVKYFNARTRSHLQEQLEKQASSTGKVIGPSDAAYLLMEKGDQKVQDVALISMMMSSYINENGEIVNIKQSLLKGDERITMTPHELVKEAKRKAKEQSLWETMKLDKDGTPYWEKPDGTKIDIETVQGKSVMSTKTNFVGAVKEVVAQVLGNADLNNIMGLNLVPGVKAFLQFRNWMFGTGEGVWGNTKYEPLTGTYRQGRMRTLSRALTSNFWNTLGILMKGLGGDKFAPSIQAAAKEDYEKTKHDWESKTGTPFTENEQEHLHRYVGNIQANGRHFAMLIGFALIISIVKADDDDTPDAKARSMYVNRYLKKFMREFLFWFSPQSAQELFSNTIPAMGLLVDFMKFLGATEGQIEGYIRGDEAMMKRNRPLKRGIELFPLTKQVIDISALYWSQEMRDEWGMYQNSANYSFY